MHDEQEHTFFGTLEAHVELLPVEPNDCVRNAAEPLSQTLGTYTNLQLAFEQVVHVI